MCSKSIIAMNSSSPSLWCDKQSMDKESLSRLSLSYADGEG